VRPECRIIDSQAGLVVLKGWSRIVHCDPTVRRLVGYHRARAPRFLVELFGAPDHARLRRAVSVGEGRLELRRDSRELWIDVATVSEPALVTLFVRDVTALNACCARLADREREASLGRLTAGVAHALNNSLTIVDALTQGLALDMEEGRIAGVDLAERLADLTDGVERLRSLVRHVNGYGDTRDRMGVVRLGRVLGTVRGLLGHRLRDVGWDCDVDGSILVLADENRLVQVLVAVVENALDAVAGWPSPEVRVRAATEQGRVGVEIVDSGPGVPTGLSDAIFEPFVTTSAGREHRGVGLTVARYLAQEMGGCLEHRPLPDAGGRFVLELKLYDLGRTGKPRVLLVEDDPLVARSLMRSSALSDFEVEHVESAGAARTRIYADHFDAVLSDVQLPGRHSGLDLLEWLRARRQRLANRALLMTGRGLTEAEVLRLDGHPVPVISKPFKATDLAEELKILLTGERRRETRVMSAAATLQLRLIGTVQELPVLDLTSRAVRVSGCVALDSATEGVLRIDGGPTLDLVLFQIRLSAEEDQVVYGISGPESSRHELREWLSGLA